MARIFDAATGLRPPGWNFTRASGNATYINSNKVLVTAPANVERLDYDPNTGVLLGLLIEPSAVNYLAQSNDFLYSTWFKGNNTSVTLVSGAALDGSSTLYRLYSTVDGSALARGPDSSMPSAPQKTISIRTKSRTGVAQTAGFWDGSQSNRVDIPATGYAVTQYTASANKSPEFNFYPFFGNGTLDLEILGAQEEVGLKATSYIDTGSGASSVPASRAADNAPFTLAPGATALTFGFDNGSTQTVSGLTGGSTYTPDPASLNRSRIMTIDDNTVAAVLRRRPLILMAS